MIKENINEMVEDQNSYVVETHCRNCREPLILKIPKGTLVSNYMLKYKCDKCGCCMASGSSS